MLSGTLSFLEHEKIVPDLSRKEDAQLFIHSFVITDLDYWKAF